MSIRDAVVDAPADAVRDTMLRALAVLRVVLLLNTLALGWFRRDSLVHPVAAIAVLAVVAVWTAVALWAYAVPSRRLAPLLVLDLALAGAAILLSPAIKSAPMQSTLPGFWVLGVVLAWAIVWRWQGGLVAALVVNACDVLARVHIDQTNYGNIFLLMIGGPVVGFLTGLLTDMARARDRAERAAAAAEERVRLARAVHDGVLQVLALVQRRGTEIGGATADLGRLAGEQEVALRSLVQAEHAAGSTGTGGGPGDLVTDLGVVLTALGARPSPRTSVSVPGEAVLVPGWVAEEVVSLVRACLHNVSDHVGEQEQAWVLLEDLGAEVVVSVRDDGPGIAAERLDEAVAAGRLGVSESIRGRARDLGGTATLTTAPGRGTEWEFTIPLGPTTREARQEHR